MQCAVSVEGNVGKNILFPPEGSPQVRGARSLKSGNKDEFRLNEVRAFEYGQNNQNNVNMNQRQVSLPACFHCGRTGHYYSVCNTYPNMQPRGERCQQCNGQHLPASCYKNRPRYQPLVIIGLGMEMSSIEETFLMVIISIITSRVILGTLIGLVAIIEGKRTDPLITLEISPVVAHTMQTSKKD